MNKKETTVQEIEPNVKSQAKADCRLFTKQSFQSRWYKSRTPNIFSCQLTDSDRVAPRLVELKLNRKI